MDELTSNLINYFNFQMELANNGSSCSNNTDELLRAQTLLWGHIFNHIDSMSLKCAVELGIPQAIDNHRKPITVPELLSSLSISPSKAPKMRRLMGMLAHSGIFAQSNNAGDDDEEVAYSLTPMSSILVDNINLNLSEFLRAMLHPVIVDPFQSMSAWFQSTGDEPTPFSYMHGFDIWEMTRRNPKFNKVFNEGLVSDAKFVTDVLIKECGHVFEGVESLVDVGGGTGSVAMAISKAFPSVKCSVLELPQVVNDAIKNCEDKGEVDFICGDMFEHIPPTDAILLKWILHDWSDEDCVKILKRCKESIKEDGGKVIILDLVVGSNNSYEGSREAQLYMDMLMMVVSGGAERSEREWKKIFNDAGFRNCKITPALGLRSVIEVYP